MMARPVDGDATAAAVCGGATARWAAELERWVILQTGAARLRGLIARPVPSPSEGWLLPQCAAVHTFGMAYPIDVVFLGAGGRIQRVQPGIGPGRVACLRGALAVVELRAGQAQALAWQVGRHVRIRGSLHYR